MSGNPAWMAWPLPQGWEARYDANTRRYFFINHTTHSTQWVDPRIAIYDEQQRNIRNQQSHEAQEQQRRDALVQRLLNEHPSADKDTIEAIVASHPTTADDVLKELISEVLGEIKDDDEEVGNDQETVDESQNETQQYDFEVDLDDADFGPSATEKLAILEAQHEKYPKLDDDVIKMACESCQWDEILFSHILQEQQAEYEQEQARKREMLRRLQEFESSTPARPQYQDEPENFNIFDDEPEEEYRDSEEERLEAERQRQRLLEEERSRRDEERRQRDEERRAARQERSRAPHNEAQDRAPRRAHPPRETSNRVTYNSQYAVGRDPTLAKGRDDKLTAPKSNLALGRDPALSQGRDKYMAQGRNAALAKGRDPGLVGRKENLALGRNPDLAHGRNSLLVGATA